MHDPRPGGETAANPGGDAAARAREALPVGSASGRSGARVGPYLLGQPLGAGGMGVVYRARDAAGRDLALKLIRATSAQSLVRFRREAELLARFRHPGILRVHDFGEVEGLAWIATELVEGALPLDAAFRERSLEGRLELIAQAASALGVVHAAGIVHRDVKPDNLLLSADGRVRVTDFGISLAEGQERLTLTGQLIGTASHLSPEQASGSKEVGPQADVWALGVILYEALTDRQPFEVESLPELFGRILRADFPPPRVHAPQVPRHLEAVCLRALSLDPAERYPDGAAFCAALSDSGPPRRRRWPLLLAAVVSLTAAGLGLAYAVRDPQPAASQAPAARASAAPSAAQAEAILSAEDEMLLRAGLPDELAARGRALEAAGARRAAGRCYGAAAAKRPREPFHRDWLAGARMGDPACVDYCLASLAREEVATPSRRRGEVPSGEIVASLEEGAEAGAPAAMEAYGALLCERDSPAPFDYPRGLAFLRRVDTPRARAHLGALGRLGVGGLSQAQAEALLRGAAAEGDALGQRALALSLLTRPVKALPRAEVLVLLGRAADGGDRLALVLVQQERKAKPPAGPLTERARGGDPLACVRTGDLLRVGSGVPLHYLGAHDFFRLARAGVGIGAVGNAYYELARLHRDQLEDLAGALVWGERALEIGLAEHGPEERPAFARRLLEALLADAGELVEGGDPTLNARLGKLARQGLELGSPQAALTLGRLWGSGPEPDLRASREAYAAGARLGQSYCMIQLARYLREGKGGPADPTRALEWARRAIAAGEPRGHRFLVFCMYRGDGCRADPAGALAYAQQNATLRPHSDLTYAVGRLLVASGDRGEREEGVSILERCSAKAAGDVLRSLRARGGALSARPYGIGTDTE